MDFPWAALLVAGILGGLLFWIIQRRIPSSRLRLALALAVLMLGTLTPFAISYLASGICLPHCTVPLSTAVK